MIIKILKEGGLTLGNPKDGRKFVQGDVVQVDRNDPQARLWKRHGYVEVVTGDGGEEPPAAPVDTRTLAERLKENAFHLSGEAQSLKGALEKITAELADETITTQKRTALLKKQQAAKEAFDAAVKVATEAEDAAKNAEENPDATG